MIKFGRALSVLAVLGFAATFFYGLTSSFRAVVDASSNALFLLNAFAALAALAAFVGWGLAIYHWGSRYPPGSPGKKAWGFVVIVTVFVGSWLYWFIGAQEPEST